MPAQPDEPTRTRWGVPLVAIGLLFGAYAGSYHALVLRELPSVRTRGTVFVPFIPDYQYGGVIAHAIFWPAHWLDRNLVRPEYWRGRMSVDH
jgi:hypothetical protein